MRSESCLPRNLDSIREKLQELENLDLQGHADDFIYTKVRELLSAYGARPIGLDTSNRVFRIRRNVKEHLYSSREFEWTPALFSQVRQAWYPPADAALPRGRANAPRRLRERS